MSQERTVEEILEDIKKLEEECFSPSELKDVRRFQEWLKPGLMAVFNEDNFACVTCDKPVKECSCSKEVIND